ncbi:MiaB/RimO family radical SAM methylthiotransferase [Anaeromyxobacter oryzae]|uniref:tRNA (N(6)-L-threonylcarbamoyladenosine(37)-C(2) )-methylthiotransferase MtaB n=1 Tax=Anaeromyxobacter oryzae TaxID=2918170 RepID=A0ABM7X3E9_9BACT|nr:MiaB/RimO family radical SAM methylthiotransferase [Anaeromyxobacter oryzae]BDG06331.1 tRNA (N(6)-L-threonylcarbamoyladenosine(37)-C(2))-methylthiotransferase MtaB [Anaeromyxobacter oryzae]
MADGSSDGASPGAGPDGPAGGRARPAARVALVALGCRVNRADLDALAAGLPDGFEVAADGAPADFVVVNTCTITSDADSVARQAIRRAAREHPGARIVAAGCYAELCPEALSSLPGVEAVVGVRSQAVLGEVLVRLEAGARGKDALAAAVRRAPGWGPAPLDLPRHTRPFLKVQDGCDARCSYCVVPLARGGSRSLAFDEAVARLMALGTRHREVVLTGVHLGAYGRDLAPRRSLAELVREAVARGVGARLRLSSVEPLEFPVELVLDPVAGRALCEHFHLPVQSGSPRVLHAMRRPYRPEQFDRTVRDLAALVPGACLGTDVMVGFPGETDADHRATVELLEALPLAYLHVFPFSPRLGTPAAGMKDRVPRAVQRDRARELLALSDRKWRAFVAGQAGRELEVVVERVEGGLARGTSRQYVTVRWPAAAERRGDVARVRIEASDRTECFGVRAGAFTSRLPP